MALQVQVVIDCADPDRLATFWARALDYVVQPPPPGFASWDEALEAMGVPPEQRNNTASACIDPEGVGPRLFFQRVPEPKTVKNRVHVDLRARFAAGPGASAEEERAAVLARVDDLVAAGGTRLTEVAENGQYWVVMADPEGNELCVS